MLKCCLWILTFVLALASTIQARDENDRAKIIISEPEIQKIESNTSAKNATIEAYSAVSLEKNLISEIDTSLKFLTQTLKSFPPKSEPRLQMLHKILGLTMEQASYVGNQEQSDFEILLKNWSQTGKSGPEPKLQTKLSSQYWQSLIGIAKQILQEYPNHSKAALVHFYHALAQQFLGRETEAAQAFAQIIKTYPKSQVAGDAQFSLGDFYFSKNDFHNAALHFEKSLQFPDSNSYSWAQYKLAWSYFNLSQYEKALRYWKQLVSNPKEKLREEVLQNMVLAFAELNNIDESIAFYKKVGGESYIPEMIKSYAVRLLDQGKQDQAILAFNRLQSQYPTSSQAFAVQLEKVRVLFESKQFSTLWSEVEKLITNYNESSAWASAHEKNIVSTVQDKIIKAVLYFPKLIHKEAQNKNDITAYKHARTGYLLFLKHYPSHPEVVEIQEYTADIEYFTGDFHNAGQRYQNLVLLGKNKALIKDTEGKVVNIHERSAKNMLDAYSKAFEPELKSLSQIKPDFSKPKKLSLNAQSFIEGCRLFLENYPKDTQTTKNCEAYTGEIYYRYAQKEDAKKALWVVITKFPGSKEGTAAIENLIPLLSNDKNLMVFTAQKLLEVPSYAQSETGKKLKELVRLNELDLIKSEKDPAKRGERYEKYARENPKDPKIDKLWLNAAVDHLKGGQAVKASEAYLWIVTNFPNSSTYQASLLQLPQLYERLLEYPRAIQFYDIFRKKYPQAKEAYAAFQKTCQLAIASNPNQAIERCIEMTRAHPENIRFLDRLIDVLWFNKDFDTMKAFILNQYAPQFRLSNTQKVKAYYKIYKSSPENSPEAQKSANSIMTLKTGLEGDSPRFAGEIVFKTLQPLYTKFIKKALVGGNVDALQSSIQSSSNSLINLEKAYSRLFALKDPYWGIAGFYQLGSAYVDFVKKLENPPTVEGASLEEVKTQLKGSAAELRSKAAEYFKVGSETAEKFQVLNEWRLKLMSANDELKGLPTRPQDWVPLVDYISNPLNEAVLSYLKD